MGVSGFEVAFRVLSQRSRQLASRKLQLPTPHCYGHAGGNAAANAIQKECEEQDVVCTVVGIPKSIDNDILLVRCNEAPFGTVAVRAASSATLWRSHSSWFCRSPWDTAASDVLLVRLL